MRPFLPLAALVTAAFVQQPGHVLAQQPGSGTTLDYDFFRAQVQPIFLAERPGHSRCVSCHAQGNRYLQPLSPGAATWSEEQSRQNFEAIRRLVVPGDLPTSVVLYKYLAHKAINAYIGVHGYNDQEVATATG